MNRSERRAAAARAKTAVRSTPANVADTISEATGAFQQGRLAEAEVMCKRLLAQAPAHAPALNLLGLIHQAAGRHKLAVKTFATAIAANDLDPACHYNIASSYQALDQRGPAIAHFNKAIALGLSGMDVEQFLLKHAAVLECTMRTKDNEFTAPTIRLDDRDIAAIADYAFLQSALQTTIIRGATLEIFLTNLRAALLRVAGADPDGGKVDDRVASLFCALAQQCFLNEYVYAQSDDEARAAGQLRALLLQKLSTGGGIAPLLLAAVGAYFPLHALAGAAALLARDWPQPAAALLQQQVREPLQELEERRTIPALTPVNDETSARVMQQYEENPYPRWTVNPRAALAGDPNRKGDGGHQRPGQRILIAGCGTGEHPFEIAQKSPDAHILAVDLSRVSLAYAQRKTREHGLRNVEYAQADILDMAGIGRTFDRIEAVGVLHHLADPKAGWRVLLSLLAPDGVMRVGLYSEAARRAVVEARALIAARGFRATPEDIRAFRQTLIRARNEPRWDMLIRTVDFYSLSGCRDILFNVMEHRLSIPDIAAFLDEERLSFLGFELEGKVVESFQRQYPGADALLNLDYWNRFEAANPDTFRRMYIFSVRRKEPRLP